MRQKFIVLAASLGFLGVTLGAFGAHALESTLESNGHEDTFRTATQYHLIHTLALFAVAWLIDSYPEKLITWAGYLFILGIVFFSGSLYLLSIFDWTFMGAIAPIGGIAFLGGWACIGLAAWHGNPN
jgi:uncharacterized membrane protein YgdD (TMEM256/DUF423 family)